jgi:PHS family inorganic phosphate transporter-like MFS transporter
MAPFIIALLFLVITSDDHIRFRFVLGLGAVPAFICFLATLGKPESSEFQKASSDSASQRDNVRHKIFWKALIGTGGSWLLYDICYYGTALFAPKILGKILGDDDEVGQVCWHAIVSNAMGIPGVLATIAGYRYFGTKNLQILGFLLTAVAYVALAIVFAVAKDEHIWLFIIYCFLVFTLNFGPNVTTFTLPQETYPTEVRSTFNGFSAALAKVGAVIGTVVYGPLNSLLGLPVTLFVCAGVSIMGAVVTLFFVSKHSQLEMPPVSSDLKHKLLPRP